MSDLISVIEFIAGFVTGGGVGSIITILYSRIKNRLQRMDFYYMDDDVISKIPLQNEEGTKIDNLYVKEFILKNTTNQDQEKFKLIVEFDSDSKILGHTDWCKDGTDKLEKLLSKDNEYSVIIKNFNRNEEVKFQFNIANISNNHINVTESDCIGFKIRLKDKRKKKHPTKLTYVSKERLNRNE